MTKLIPFNQPRDKVLKWMLSDKAYPIFYPVPLHRSERCRRAAARPTERPVTDDLKGQRLLLPLYNRPSVADGDRVVDGLLSTESATKEACGGGDD
jgi:dTDP-4-amino-4,6-dideoxygalactose transaminase